MLPCPCILFSVHTHGMHICGLKIVQTQNILYKKEKGWGLIKDGDTTQYGDQVEKTDCRTRKCLRHFLPSPSPTTNRMQTIEEGRCQCECYNHRVHIEWQWPLSGVHFIMIEKSQSGEGGECNPSPFHSIYHHEQSCGVRSRGQTDTLPLFLQYPYM